MCGCVCIELQGLTTKICLFLGQAKPWLKSPRPHLGLFYSTPRSHSTDMLNRSFDQFRIPYSHFLPYNDNISSELQTRITLPQIFPYCSFSQWSTSANFLFQMSQPTIASCYEEIIKDPSLLQLFPLEKYSSVCEFPCLGALWFRLISEGFFTCICSPDHWRKAGLEFLTITGLKMSGKTTFWQLSSLMG